MFWETVWDALLDTLLDGVKLLPFLFLAYLAIELIEKKMEERSVSFVNRAGRWGPVVGGLLGVIPQCGFSAAASNLYAGGVITAGTLLAVFLSTSDEMLPIFLSQQVSPLFIGKVLLFKALAGILVGLLADLLLRRILRPEKTIHEICEQEGCHCEDGVFKSALRHTLKIFAFLLAVTFLLNVAVALVGEERLSGFLLNRPVVGEMLSALLGLIPNCAGSVVITQLYLQGGMTVGALLSGLLVNSGVGLLVLFRMNRHHMKENLLLLLVLYVSGVVLGLLGGLLPIF